MVGLKYTSELAHFPKNMGERLSSTFNILRDEYKEIRDIAEHKTHMMKIEISGVTIPRVLNFLRFDILMNLIDYSNTGVKPRDKTIEEAFWILDYLIGFDYNKVGSFTRDGAKRAMNEDLTLRRQRYRIEVAVEGRLKDLEEGEVDWSNLRRFFYSHRVQTQLKIMFPNTVDRIYRDLTALFAKTKDPTEPKGRPYISQAVIKSKEYMHDAIQDSVIDVFGKNEEGGWVRTK